MGERGLEPPRLAAQPPQDCAYTSSATRPSSIPVSIYFTTDSEEVISFSRYTHKDNTENKPEDHPV